MRRSQRTSVEGTLKSGATGRRSAAGKKFDAELKHIIALRYTGFITAQPDPTDKRRQLYVLSPNIKIAAPSEGRTMDFGYCVVHVARWMRSFLGAAVQKRMVARTGAAL